MDPKDTRLEKFYAEYRSGKRAEFPLNLDVALKKKLAGSRILVTGSGSVGGQLVEQLLYYRPSRLLVADISEYSLHYLQRRCDQMGHKMPIDFKLLDVCSLQGINDIMSSHQIDIVIHTAAYKHLPRLESNIRRAFEVNFQGTLNLIQAAEDHGVSEMVFVSTDKAVEPTSILGMTKLLAENYIRNRSKQAEVSVNINIARFGNVLGSSGSVVPIWEECIQNNKRLPVSDSGAERFFLSSSQANQLILSTLLLGRGGETFVFEMGEPIRIVDLAASIYHFWKGEGLSDNQIQWIGLKPGEKLTERFYERDATLIETDYEKVLSVKGLQLPSEFSDQLENLVQNNSHMTESQLKEQLMLLSRHDNKADSLK